MSVLRSARAYSWRNVLRSWQTPSQSIAEASEHLTSRARVSPIPRLIYRFHDSICRAHHTWFLQLESCNSGSANPHGCVVHSGLHDITAQRE